MFRPRFAILAALLACCLPVTAQTQLLRQVIDPKSNSYAEVTALFSSLPSHGFVPVRVVLANQTKEDRTARFQCDSSDGTAMYGGNGMKMESSFEVATKAGETVTRDLMVPVATCLNTYSYSGAELRVSMRGGFDSADGRLSTVINTSQQSVLMSSDLHTKNASTLDAALTGTSSRGNIEFAGSFQPGMLPEDWRAYAGYDVILMTDADWRKVSISSRRAIQQWLRLGGYLRVYQTSSTKTPPADLDLTPDPKNANYFRSSAGSVELASIATDLTIDKAIIKQLEAPSYLLPQSRGILESFSSHWPLQVLFGQRGFSYGLFLLVLVVFAVVVGPVNLFVFAKSNERHRLFFTTPIISLAASALLIIMIFLQDGLGGRGMRVVLCEVRPEAAENTAYLTQEQFSRTGVLLGSRFKIDTSTVITPLPINDSAWARLSRNTTKSNGSYSITGQDDGSLRVTGDWFQSRSEQGQQVKTILPTRGRLEAVPNTPQPTIFSTFDFPLDTVVMQGQDNKAYRADNVSPGQRITMKEIPNHEYQAFLTEQQHRFSGRNQSALERLSSRPGHYVAITHSAPGVDTLSSIRWTETTTVLTGPLAR